MLFSITPAGTVRWATRHGGTGRDRGIRTAIGPHGEVLTGGKFQQTATFGTEVLTSAGGNDAFLMATTASGGPLWARGYGGPADDEIQSVVLDDMGRIYATGAFSDTITFGGPTLTSAGGFDTFLFRLDPEIVVPAQ